MKYMAHLMADKWQAPVYRYITNFTAVSPDQDLSTGLIRQEDGDTDDYKNDILTKGFHYAYHGIDIRHFFAEHEDDLSSDAAFIASVRKVVFEFVREGEIKDWRPFPQSSGVLSSHVTQINRSQYHGDKCDFWNRNTFIPQHAWMNK